jgi:hypothetical protein
LRGLLDSPVKPGSEGGRFASFTRLLLSFH